MFKNVLRTQHPTSNTNMVVAPPKLDFPKIALRASFKISMLIWKSCVDGKFVVSTFFGTKKLSQTRYVRLHNSTPLFYRTTKSQIFRMSGLFAARNRGFFQFFWKRVNGYRCTFFWRNFRVDAKKFAQKTGLWYNFFWPKMDVKLERKSGDLTIFRFFISFSCFFFGSGGWRSA